MNVFDFDRTIFMGDTEDRFFRYIFQKKGLFLYRLNHAFWELFYKLRLTTDKTIIRQEQYRVLKRIDNLDELIAGYWEEHAHYIMPWYLKIKQPTDIIATGTPRFLMEPIMKRLGLSGLVATDMDRKTGRITGRFTVGKHKVEAFKAQFNPDEIDAFYSDAYSDYPLAAYAKRAFIVHGNAEITEWNAYFQTHPKK